MPKGKEVKESEVIRVEVHGPPKSGKTHFALTAPEPIEYFLFDTGFKFVAKKFPDKDIRIHEFPSNMIWVEGDFPIPASETDNGSLYAKFAKDYFDALRGDAKTMVIDTGTRLWEIVHTAYLQYLQKQDPSRNRLIARDYGKPNSAMRSVIDGVTACPVHKNLIIIDYVKDEWGSDGKPTGNVIPHAWDATVAMSDVALEFKMLGKADKARVKGVISESRPYRELTGLDFEDPTFDEIYEVLMTER